MESFELRETFDATPEEIFEAWLDSQKHSEMTGGDATCSKSVGGQFEVWDGYIAGKNIELIEYSRIVQSWRTSEFKEEDEDSILTIDLIDSNGRTELLLRHERIPKGQTQYLKGWKDHYFAPMRNYF